MIGWAKTLSAAALLAATSQAGLAADPASCRMVRLSDPGWTDIDSTTALTTAVLKGLGYQTDVKVLSLAVTFAALKSNNIDVFLGNWMPSQVNDIKSFLDEGSIEQVGVNLRGAKYTLAVPKTLYDAGLKDFADIQKFRDQLDGKIYGVEAGNDGNSHILQMIQTGDFGLKSFELVESSEQGMLSQVERATRAGKGIVFLGWAPHPMNTTYRMEYLTGGDAYFGPDFGGATVYTVTGKGYAARCPNLGTLLRNMVFDLDVENTVMGLILDKKQEPDEAARTWLKAHPERLDAWLKGVQTFEGADGKASVLASLAQ